MTGSQQHQTMLFSYATDEPASLAKQRKRTIVSLAPSMVGHQFNMWQILSPELKRTGKQISIQCQCLCGHTQWVDRWNLQLSKSRGCLRCMGQMNRLTPSSPTLGRRYDAIIARCSNPKNPKFKDYGGRGIECRFGSRAEFVRYVEQFLPHSDYKGLEIDRENNNGHYEPGNLRLTTRAEQLINRRSTRWSSYKGQKVPQAHAYHVLRTIDSNVLYSPLTVANLVRKLQLSIEEIIVRYYTLVSSKPKGLTTLPMPDIAIASRYLGT